jgi:hypothetical protein
MFMVAVASMSVWLVDSTIGRADWKENPSDTPCSIARRAKGGLRRVRHCERMRGAGRTRMNGRFLGRTDA